MTIFGGLYLQEYKDINDKSIRKSPKIENVIFFGAGASKAENAPLQNELFREFFNLNKNNFKNDIETFNTFKKIKIELSKFFEYFFNIQIKDKKSEFPTFEEALGILELSLKRKESYKKCSDITKIQENLIFAMAIIIKKKLEKYSNYHGKLVERIEKKGKLLNTAFVSLNL